jgi:drug/metabolite transporter (DMT)-like permease
MNVRAASLFAAVSVLWGAPYLMIKVALDNGFTPLSLVWCRLLLAAVILLVWAAHTGALKQLKGHWKPIAVYAFVELAIPFPMIGIGERHVASSLAAIVIATVPLLVALFSLGFDRSDRVNRRQFAGLMLGLIGVILLVGLDASSSSGQLLGVGALLIAAVGYALGPLILRNYFQDVDPYASMGAAMAIAVVAVTPWALLDLPSRTPTIGGFAAVVGLAVLCGAMALVLMALLVREIGATRAVVITYVNPVVALILGVIFLSETPGVGALGGLVLILLGSWVSAAQPRAAAAAVGDETLVARGDA